MTSDIVTLKWMRYIKNDYLVIYASSMAACAGMHPYQSQRELKDEFMSMMGTCDDPDYVKPDEIAEQDLLKLPLVQREKIKAVVDASYSSATQVIEAFTKLTTAKSDEDETVKSESEPLPATVIDKIRSAMYTKHGQEQESVIRDAFSKEIKKPVRTSNKFKKGHIICSVTTSDEPHHTIDVYVGGKHDGMVDDKIVEIKTRQRRFLGTPIYELVQVHTYMYIYGTRQAIIVESYNGEERKHEINFDDELWDKVKTKIAEFVEDILARQ
jgi:hypothetical protein